ncbi:MAG: extracellular solute-binding protein [bacterium]|nr:extracellular solute-binding protein [bacterium]
MKARLLLIALVATMLFLVSGLVVAQDVEITYWDTMNDQEREVFGVIVEECATELGITVNYEYVPFDQAQATYRTAAQGDNAPDILRTEVAWGPEFAALGYTLDLTDMITEEERASYLVAPFNYNTWGGRIWGLPQVTDAPALVYNKSLLEAAGVEVPTTMDELIAAAEAIAALSTEEAPVYGIATLWAEYAFQPFMWAYGGSLITVNEDGTYSIGINSEGTVEALGVVKGLLDSGVMGPGYDPANQYGNSMTAFKDGQVGFFIMGPWATADILSGAAFAETPENLGVAAIPAGPAGQGSPVGGHGYTIYAGTDYPEESLAFIRCLNSVENQVTLATELNLVPTLLEAYENEELAANEILQGFLAQMQVATNRPVLVAGGSIYTEFSVQYQEVLLNGKDAQEAMDAVAAAWELLLESEPPVPGE